MSRFCPPVKGNHDREEKIDRNGHACFTSHIRFEKSLPAEDVLQFADSEQSQGTGSTNHLYRFSVADPEVVPQNLYMNPILVPDTTVINVGLET